MRVIVVDALAREHGKRVVTVDAIGAGPRAVAALVESRGFRVQLYPLEAVLQDPRILGEHDVLMVSAMSSDKPAARMLAELWKRYSSGPSVIGGPIAVEPLEAVKLGYDYAVYGEAEAVIPDAMEHITRGVVEGLYTIRGLAFKHKGRVVFTGRPGFVPPEKLGYKHFTRIENYEAYWAARVYVEIVRGCSNWRRPRGVLPDGRACLQCDICARAPLSKRLYCPAYIPPGCGYCSVPAIYGYARSRPIDVIVEEVRELIDKGVMRIVLSAPDVLDYGRDWLVKPEPLTDPCMPLPNLEALRLLFEKLFERVPEFETRDAYLMIENVKACLVTREVARLLGEYIRGTPVHIGVETGSDRHMWLIGRPIRGDDAKRAVKLLHEAGLEPYVYFIYGLPWETTKTVKETVSLMEELWRLGARKITVYRFRPLPGTAFQDFEPPPPGSYSRVILRKALELNKRAKNEVVGRVVKAIIAGWHPVRKMLVAYPLPHGPVILVKGARRLVGWVARIEVTGVVSERMLRGRIVRLVKRVARNMGYKVKGLRFTSLR